MFSPTTVAAVGAAAAPPTEPTHAAPALHPLSIRFTGSGSEYFRLWIVNLLLTVVTLGLYLPWARARKLRWFHGHTLIGGHALGFHGRPAAMLRGVLLVGLLVAIYIGADQVSPAASFAVLLLFGLAWPALIDAALRFRMANTSWRGLRAAYLGTLGGTYRAVAPALVPVLGYLTLTFLAVPDVEPGETAEAQGASVGLLGLAGALLFLGSVMWPWAACRLRRHQQNHLAWGPVRLQLDLPAGGYYRAMLAAGLVGALGLALTAVLAGVLLWLTRAGGITEPGGVWSQVLGILVVAPVYVVSIALSHAWYATRIQNLVWSRTLSLQVRLGSTLALPAMLKLAVRNALLTLVTLGLYWPFAEVAVTRMKLQAIELDAVGDVESWVGATPATGRTGTVGDAAAEMLGIDVGL